MNFDKYNPLKKQQPTATGDDERAPESWRDSPTICRLSVYLKEHSEHGIRVIERNGIPALSFSPGLTTKSNERWRIAMYAERLFWDAFPDLRQLVAGGSVTLPGNGAGPS